MACLALNISFNVFLENYFIMVCCFFLFFFFLFDVLVTFGSIIKLKSRVMFLNMCKPNFAYVLRVVHEADLKKKYFLKGR